MKYNFTKMHGIGNDYVYFNCIDKNLISSPEKLSIFVSDRHFGIGSDGIILILPSNVADFKMRMFNADGSEGRMCGNAIRCVGKYVYDNNYTDKKDITIETLSGIKNLKLSVTDNKVSYVEVDMGKAILEPKKILVSFDKDIVINEPLSVCDDIYMITCVSMGNPHAVTFVDDVNVLDLEKIGPLFENHKLFPERINTEFVQIISPQMIKMRVWERGSGETFACGTGACASVVASVLNGYCMKNEEVTVCLRGGELKITWKDDDTVLMKGPATKVFDGEIDY